MDAKLVELRARPYQVELLAAALARNTIVYLGTGSGKTFVAVMLIREHRAALAAGKRAVFLVNSVALVDQQAEAIRKSTGFSVGSYCGADGVDDWDEQKWRQELQDKQVLVLIHQVFLDLLSRRYFSLKQAAVLVLDECHHAQVERDHPYSCIMRDWYHNLKAVETDSLPRVLGLTACLVVKTVTVAKFRQEKHNLEKILDSTVETVDDLYEILKFVTNPTERIVYYDDQAVTEQPGQVALWAGLGIAPATSVSQQRQTLLDIIHKTIQAAENIYGKEKEIILDTENSLNYQTTQVDSLTNDYKVVKNQLLGSLQTGLMRLGLVCLPAMLVGLQGILDRLENRDGSCWYRHSVKTEMVQATRAGLAEIAIKSDQLQYRWGEESELGKLQKLCSPQLLCLTEELQTQQEEAGSQRVIVFVEQKFIAEALCRLLEEFARLEPRLAWICPDFAYSPGAGLNCKDPVLRELVNQERRKLRRTLERFRAGETNTIVSTAVIEEGLDVRTCNLVIKFDFPATFRSYVQSKGRARALPSRYLLLLARGDTKRVKQYEEYLRVEELALTECHRRIEAEEAGLELNTAVPQPYLASPADPDSARVVASQAVALLYRWVQAIPVDRFTRLTPVWQEEMVMASDQVGYQVTCYMPHKTPFNHPVVGDIKPTKKFAKQSTALKIIKTLHELGHLDGRLRIKKNEDVKEDEEDDENRDDCASQGKTGTKRRRRFFERRTCAELICRKDGPFFLHRIRVRLEQENPSYKYQVYRPEEDSAGLGLVTSTRLPHIGPLHLHSPAGLQLASVTFSNQLELESGVLDQVQNFHQYVFSSALQVTQQLEYNRLGPLVVPLMANQLDTALLSRFSNLAPSGTKLDLSRVHESVIYTPYRPNPVNYYVERVEHQLRVTDRMADSNLTFQQHYRDRYGLQLADLHQPLLGVSSADRRPYMLVPAEGQASPAKRAWDSRAHTLLLPELVLVSPLPAGLWRQAYLLPSVLHRITSLLGAASLLPRLGFHNSAPIRLVLDPAPACLEPHQTLTTLLSPGQRDAWPTPGRLLQALTTPAAGDAFNLERLEVLGDVFLKFSTTEYLYYQQAGAAEGALSALRSRVVGNRNLYQVGSAVGLPSLLVAARLEPATTWCPPGWDRLNRERLLERLALNWLEGPAALLSLITEADLKQIHEDETGMLSRLREREVGPGLRLRSLSLLADKTVADAVEALLGCFLLSVGRAGTLLLMARLGLNLSSSTPVPRLLAREPCTATPTHFPPQQTAFTGARVEAEAARAAALYARLGAEQIERVVGYTFRERSFLLQAFTHASYADNRLTESYEKLEFLGDAVLDYIVTAALFSRSGADPGQLTELRSALVNNNVLADICVELGLHTHIMLASPALLHRINAYTDQRRLLQSTLKPRVDINLDLINEVESPQLELVEVPKVLGDVFEALLGAIYLDSGHSLETVWRVYDKHCAVMMQQALARPPVNHKKELMERFPGRVTFLRSQTLSGKVTVTARISDEETCTEFKGLGPNKKVATMAACKLALRRL